MSAGVIWGQENQTAVVSQGLSLTIVGGALLCFGTGITLCVPSFPEEYRGANFATPKCVTLA